MATSDITNANARLIGFSQYRHMWNGPLGKIFPHVFSQFRTVRSYVRPVFWPFSHGHDEIRGANRLISFSRCNALAILRSDVLRDVVPLGHHNWHLACLSDWSAGKLVYLSLDDHLRSPLAIASNEKSPDDARDLVCECDSDNLERAAQHHGRYPL